MDGQNADDTRTLLPVRRSQRSARLPQLAQIAHKCEQPPALAAFKAACKPDQRRDMLLPRTSARRRAENAHRICAVDNGPQQLPHRDIRRKQPQIVQRFQKIRRLGIVLCRCAQGGEKVPFPVCQANFRQLLFGKARQRRGQCRDQRHILPGIV